MDTRFYLVSAVEDKQLRRERTPQKGNGILAGTYKHPLSLDIIDSDAEGRNWDTDPRDLIEEFILTQTIAQFRLQLTPRQLDVFEKCLLEGMSLSEYAKGKKLNYRAVWEVREAVRKKFSNF